MSASTSERVTAAARPPRAFVRTVAAAHLRSAPMSTEPVTEADLAGLPPVAVPFPRGMGVIGRPGTWSLRAHVTGRFRRRPGQPWMPLDAWQYNSAVEVARII